MSEEAVILINLLKVKPGKQEALIALLKQNIETVIHTLHGWRTTRLIAAQDTVAPGAGPPVPGQHRHDAADLDTAGAGAARPTAAGDDRPVRRRDRGQERLRHRRQPAQALRPDAAHHAAGLPAHVQEPGPVAYPCNCLTISSASLTCPLMLVIELKICRTVPSRSIT